MTFARFQQVPLRLSRRECDHCLICKMSIIPKNTHLNGLTECFMVYH
jgi:hypothetical protein